MSGDTAVDSFKACHVDLQMSGGVVVGSLLGRLNYWAISPAKAMEQIYLPRQRSGAGGFSQLYAPIEPPGAEVIEAKGAM